MAVTQLDAIVRDILLVARHVSTQPRGYCRQEAAVARACLRRVDMDLLRATVHSVTWLSESPCESPMTWDERQASDAARRLQELMTIIERRQTEIAQRLHTA